ncbi:T9SS type A sorting domain-containing protein [Yeosuana sp. MJ-SS3]|uniref:T9SS type A sorting domain-containing protein n=1 Tax=Gilvirhabdus luticola TaxID=3079858 RepID=A0ABU3U8I6_9FLAO|nr:T9SS type A sorting domain-containing protein [Yeosuana sp. MJ-SS3]MDU8886733.1 T9SS type A sorting domain-containing protein [Yeosuana sp. MJ-SS3]
MKRILLFSFLLFFCSVQAQFNQDAPWIENLNVEQRRSVNPVTFQEIVDSFNAYWANKDPNIKGSGYKPFKRWEVFWENFVKKDGTLPTQAELWNTWLKYKAQEENKSSFVDLSNWQPVGPFDHVNTGSWSSGQGRVNAIIVDPILPTTYYSGAPAGGIWKSTDSGVTWSPLSDQLPQIGVSGIAIDYNDSNIIYIATGDDDANDSYSVGVMKSIDGGAIWNTTGLNTSNSPTSMNDIYMNPNDSDMLWVATNGGVYKTIDGGTNWVEKLNGNIKDIKLKPGDPSTIYAVTTNTFYISSDFGETFSDISSGLPASSNRMVIDITPDNPDVVYVLSSLSNNFQGVYKSTNSGLTFTETSAGVTSDIFDGSTQAYYDMALAVSDTDEDEIYTGVLNIWKSSDGGANFTKLNNWSSPSSPSYTHADIHLLRFYNGELFAGTDGGFYKSSNGGSNFTDLTEGMQIGQFYRITVSNESSQKMVGGLQDNGGFALNEGQWQVYYGADGMDTAIDRFNSDLFYGFTQFGGSLNISTSSGGSLNNQIGAPTDETGTNDSGGNWITPLVMSKNGEMYAGYSKLYKFCGGSWQAISSSFGSDIDVLEIDDLNSDNIYVGLNNVLWKSTDGGFNFSNLETFSSDITSIEVNNNDSNIVYITTSGSGGKVFKKIGAATSTDITGSLPNVTKNVIKHQNLHSLNPLFLGTSLGVYRYDDTLGDWELFENNLPTVTVRDLELNLNDNNITAATYGRGIWQSSIPVETLTNELSLENIENLNFSLGCGDFSGIQARVKNLGTNTVNSIDVQYVLDGVSNSFTWAESSLATNESVLIDIPTLSPIGSNIHELKIITTIAGDTYSVNNELMKKFYSNSLGLLNTPNDFETQNDELIVSDGGICGYWERGVPSGTLLDTASSGSNVYGTNLSGNHANYIKSHLVSKCYDLSILTNPVIKFNMAFDLELNFDIVYVEYSTDSGANWNVLGTASDPNWYNSDRTYGSSGGQDCQNCPGAQWTGTDATMKEYSYDLTALGNETNIIFRFVFHSDPLESQEGVIVDDFVIEGTLSAEPFDANYFSIYPNPSKDVFNIRMAAINEFDYDLYDITGKLIDQEQNIIPANREYQLDLTNLSSGIYLLKIISEGFQTTKKLILR